MATIDNDPGLSISEQRVEGNAHTAKVQRYIHNLNC
jgi:hypothetical protein